MTPEVHENVAGPLAYLFTLERFGIKLGLDHINTLLRALDHPQRTFRAVHIAGTNGKGSTTAMIDAALRAGGYRSGRYTSPHLLNLSERFVIAGRPVDEATLTSAVVRLRSTIDDLLARGIIEAPPTFFEATTALAFDMFREARLEIAVCEVGLGGRLDATNVLEPIASAITTIGLDHQRHLGSTLREIAREKAGIVKPGIPVVVGPVPVEAYEAIEEAASQRGAPLIRAGDGVDVARLGPGADAAWGTGERISLSTPTRDYGELSLALAGTHQIDNAVVAVRALEAIGERGVELSREAIVAGLSHTVWPGRIDCRKLPDGREILLDAAHNPDGAAALSAFLQNRGAPAPIVLGVSRDKDAAGMIKALARAASAFVCTRASSSRGMDPRALAELVRETAPTLTATAVATPREALATAWGLAPRIVVAGSIFLVGDVLSELGPP